MSLYILDIIKQIHRTVIIITVHISQWKRIHVVSQDVTNSNQTTYKSELTAYNKEKERYTENKFRHMMEWGGGGLRLMWMPFIKKKICLIMTEHHKKKKKYWPTLTDWYGWVSNRMLCINYIIHYKVFWIQIPFRPNFWCFAFLVQIPCRCCWPELITYESTLSNQQLASMDKTIYR